VTAIEHRSVAQATPASARLVAAAAFALPPVMLLVVAFGLAFRGGGIAPEQWQPVALGLAAALFVLAVVGAVPRIQRAAVPMLVALAGLLAWSAASFAWTASREATFEQVIRLAMLAAAAVVGAAYAARPRAALLLAAGLALVGAAIAGAIEVRLLGGSTDALVGSRLSWPINYANADAALVWLPVPALVTFAAAQPLRPLVRGAFGFPAGLALAVGLTTQSRGAAIALAGALIACVLIASDRGRFALTLLAVAVPVAAIAPEMVGGEPASSAELVRNRGQMALIGAVAAGALVCGLALLDRRHRFPFGGREGRVAIAAWVLALAVAAGAFLSASGRPDTWASARWDEFTNVQSTASTQNASHFGTGVSNRYDYWRVAWRTFEDRPIEGVGAGAFSVPWFRSRSIDENVSDAHSWQAGALAETGLAGLVLLAAVLLLPLARIRAARIGEGSWPIAAVALGGVAVYFVLHASVDWLFRIPAVAIPGFVVLGALATGGGPANERAFTGRVGRGALAAAGLVVLALAIPAYLSTAAIAHGESAAATSTDDALAELEHAGQLNPFATEPWLIRSTILEFNGRPRAALTAANEATERGPKNWTAWHVLAQARRAAGDRGGSRAALTRAAELNPRALQLAKR
jgi:O-Antigen ligase/Tetratricopeptide repeat